MVLGKLEFQVKKTNELSVTEKRQINDLFNRVFEKNRTIGIFENQFLNNPLGYSFHAMMLVDGVVMGHHGGIPCYYMVNGEKKLAVNNVDTMIDKSCQGIENFYDLSCATFDYYKKQGVAFVYGFPNDNSYQLWIQLQLMKDVGRMSTYILPYRIGGVKEFLRFFNPISRLFCHVWLWVNDLFAKEQKGKYIVEKDADSYNATRYKRNDGKYSVKNGFVYKIMMHEGVRTAFLIDVHDKSPKGFIRAIYEIIDEDKNKFDLLLYVGNLPFNCHGLIKIPHKYEPKHFNLTAEILEESGMETSYFFDIQHWDVNLSNYDLL